RDCPLDRCCATVLRQKRSMKIDVAEVRKLKHPWWNDPSIAHDDDCLWSNLLEALPELSVVLDAFRLNNGERILQCTLLYWRSGQFKPASLRTIGLRHH